MNTPRPDPIPYMHNNGLLLCGGRCFDIKILLNTLRTRQNGRHFPDDIYKCIFFKWNVWISIIISLEFVPQVPIHNKPKLVQIMAWRRPGDKPLSEPMMVKLPPNICVTRPQINLPSAMLDIWQRFPLLFKINEAIHLKFAMNDIKLVKM